MIRTLLRLLLKVLLPIAVIGGSAWIVWTLYLTRPDAVREDVPPPIPVVSVIGVSPRNHAITIEAYGTVVPARRVMLRTQVGGRIVDHHPSLAPGGVLTQGVEVIRIDPKDYELRVKQEEVALASAKAAFDLEQGQPVSGRAMFRTPQMEVQIKMASRDRDQMATFLSPIMSGHPRSCAVQA